MNVQVFYYKEYVQIDRWRYTDVQNYVHVMWCQLWRVNRCIHNNNNNNNNNHADNKSLCIVITHNYNVICLIQGPLVSCIWLCTWSQAQLFLLSARNNMTCVCVYLCVCVCVCICVCVCVCVWQVCGQLGGSVLQWRRWGAAGLWASSLDYRHQHTQLHTHFRCLFK